MNKEINVETESTTYIENLIEQYAQEQQRLKEQYDAEAAAREQAKMSEAYHELPAFLHPFLKYVDGEVMICAPQCGPISFYHHYAGRDEIKYCAHPASYVPRTGEPYYETSEGMWRELDEALYHARAEHQRWSKFQDSYQARLNHREPSNPDYLGLAKDGLANGDIVYVIACAVIAIAEKMTSFKIGLSTFLGPHKL